MSAIKLMPGDRVSFIENGRKLRGVVADGLMLRSRGEGLLIPVVRPSSRARVRADHFAPYTPAKLRWLTRKEIRKLPVKSPAS